MSTSQNNKSVLLIAAEQDQSERLQPLAAALRTLGHKVVFCLDADAALSQPTPDVLIVDAGSAEDTKANLSITSAFLGTATPVNVMAILNEEDFGACRDAMRAGANDVFAGAFRIDDVVAAIASGDDLAIEVDADTSRELHRAFTSDSAGQGDLCRELTACATRAGVSRSHRFRVVTAAAEIAANVGEHAYEDSDGPLFLSATFNEDCVTVELRDLGHGFNTEDAHLTEVGACRGLDIAAGLADRVDVDSTSAGTKITLEFQLTPTRFDEEPATAEDLDYLTPAATRRFLETPKGAGSEFTSSALASTIGRILLASVSRTSGRTQTALWS